MLRAFAVGGLIGTAGLASAQSGPERLLSFDPATNEFPENIAIDRRGVSYVSFPERGEIRAISPNTLTQSIVAQFDVGSGVGVLGLEVRPDGTLYACLATFNTPGSDTHGIWEIPPGGGPSLFAALPATTLPNDILLEGAGLLVTDSIGGAVWRVRRGEARKWAEDPSLTGTGAIGLPFPIGANGIAKGGDGTVYVANTERGHIVAIPDAPGGGPGTPSVFVSDPLLFAVDGLAIDVRDGLYAALIAQNAVRRIHPSGRIETLAAATDKLDNPSDVTFGTSQGDQQELFITNFALISRDDPSLMKLDVGVPGSPIRP